MIPRFAPAWLRIAPILALVVVAMGGSTALVPAAAAVQQVAAAPGWAPEVNAARAAPRPPKLALPNGAIGRLTIDAIGVDAVARPVGLTAGGAMDVTSNIWEVGVFDQSVQPGQPGSSLIEGHLDWYTGPAVFWNLHKVGPGAEIDFTSADAVLHRFTVTQARNIPYNSAIPNELMAQSGTPTITLITCSGAWISSAHSYSTRLLLTATAIQA
ncbi:MAG TPA: class F sortase [Candidatus Dormibacteraeota bacterium]|jgi:sortase (surface protein transpeptidase)|nr:class F sortase [Candidatus Dormibacteraeota bacterium]